VSNRRGHPQSGDACLTTGRHRAAGASRTNRSRSRQPRNVCPPHRRLPDPDHEAFVEWFVAYWLRRGADLFADQSRTEEASTHA
jgi:hypothetical protein